MKVSSSPFETFLTSQHETKNDLEFSKLLGNIDKTKVDKSKVKDSKHKSQHNSSGHASHAGSSTKPDTIKPDQSSSSSEASGSEEPKTDGTNSSDSGSDTSSIKSLIASAEKILAYAQTAGNVLPQVADLVDVISELKSGTISKSDATTKILQIGADILQSVGDKGGSSAGSDTSSGTSSSDSTSGSDVASSTTVNRVTPDKSMDAFASTPPTSETKRPDGDTRSAQDIINDNPILKNLGNQSGIRDKLNELVGGQMTTNPDQAYRAVALLTYIKSSLGRNGADRGDIVSDGKIDGFTKDGDARHGTEAGVLQDVTKQGWGYLGQLINHQLPDTKDSHVREDGSNMDNLPWGWQHFGEPILNILTEVAGVVSK